MKKTNSRKNENMKRLKDKKGHGSRVKGRDGKGLFLGKASTAGWSPQGEAQDEIKKGQDEEGYDEKGQNKKGQVEKSQNVKTKRWTGEPMNRWKDKKGQVKKRQKDEKQMVKTKRV